MQKLKRGHDSDKGTVNCIFFKKLTQVLLNWINPVFANRVDPEQLASVEANCSGSALFVINFVNLYQQPGSSNLIG